MMRIVMCVAWRRSFPTHGVAGPRRAARQEANSPKAAKVSVSRTSAAR